MPNSLGILPYDFNKKYFSKIFLKLFALQGAPLSRFVKFCPSFCKFIMSSYYAEKIRKHLHKYFHMSFVCSEEGFTSKKKTHKKRYKEEKPERSRDSFWKMFQKLLALQATRSSFQICKIFPSFCNFIEFILR